MDLSTEARRRAYASWLRTGHWPTIRTADGLERKFNPWHDPADGRFTFAGAGQQGGAGHRASRATPRVTIDTAQSIARTGRTKAPTTRKTPPANPVTEFAAGVGEGVSTVAKDTAAGLHAALTTNPATTIHDALTGIAAKIDTAIAAEDTPARAQVRRAAHAIAHASPRDLGRATGSTIATAALAIAPEAAAARISTLRAIRRAKLRPDIKPPEFGWAKETRNPKKPWTAYNDSAPGARSDHAPTLTRPMPDGSERPVKFDGMEGGYPIERKTTVVNTPNGRGQMIRQSQALEHHHTIGVWEVPDAAQLKKFYKMRTRLNVKNIKGRIGKP